MEALSKSRQVMRKIFAVLLVVNCAAIAEEHTFKAQPPKVGDKSTRIRNCTVDSNATVEKFAEPLVGTWSTSEEISETVMAVDAGRVTRMQVKYERAEFSKTGTPFVFEPHINKELNGKSFIVEIVDAKIVVTADDPEIHRRATDEVASHYHPLLKAGSLARFLNGKTLALGVKFDLSLDCLQEIFPMHNDTRRDLSFTLKEFRTHKEERCAVFEFKGKASTPERKGEDKVASEILSEVLLSIDFCKLVKLTSDVSYSRSRYHLKGEDSGKVKATLEIIKK